MAERLRLRTAGVEWRSVEGEVLAIDVPSGRYLGTNASGALLWKALVDGATEEELVGLLVERFVVDRESASDDVAGFLDALEEQGLLAERGA
jgi:Coenzyme PQQ synthesis protein D (PqqD)